MLADFYKTYKWDGRPWLIIGMGPTFSLIKDYDISAYNLLGINKVVREMPVDLCQIIDFYILEKVRSQLLTNSKFLVMPYFPHFKFRPWLEKNLNCLSKSDNLLSQLITNNRLLAFNLSTAGVKLSTTPSVKARFFSAECAVSLLANLGVKDIKLIGVDGGTTRAKEFSDHGPTDPRGFDLQWQSINETIQNFNLNVQHLVRNPDGLHPCQETETIKTVQN